MSKGEYVGCVVVYGASDDLIEVEGAISEEFPAPDVDEDRGAYLAFSDGTVLSIEYTSKGIWRIAPVVIGRETKYEVVQATNDDDDYSDRATLTHMGTTEDDFKWVVMGTEMAKAD